MKYQKGNLQTGFGLIEVMVTLVIVALGLLALASLESQLMFNSGDNKARLEAKALAEAKIEELRESIEVGDIVDLTDGNTGYTDSADLIAGTFADTIAGTNASFARAWTITDVPAFIPTAPARKNVSVRVTWGAASADETIYAVSEIAWQDPAKALLYALQQTASGTTSVPSPRQNASEDVASERVIGVQTSSTTGGTTVDVATHTTLDVEIANENDPLNTTTVQLTQVAPNSHYYATDDNTLYFVDPGVIAVFICEGTSCTYIQNHFGGVVLRTKGMVYSNSGKGLGDIQVAWSSSDVNACYQSTPNNVGPDGIASTSDDMATMEYECVYAGNCDATAASDGIGNGNGCSTAVTDAHILSRNVGPGGEFGELGLLGVDDSGGNQEQLCFLEDTSYWNDPANALLYGAASGEAGDEDYILPVTKRFYVARRMNSDGSQTSEGINASFQNHNFLIIDRGTGPATKQGCYNEVVASSPTGNDNGQVLAPRDIYRTLSVNNEVGTTVSSENVYTGSNDTALVITGTIVSDSGNLRLYVSTPGFEGSCYIKDDNTAYACAVPNGTTDVTISGGGATYPVSSTAYATCSPLIGGTAFPCVWPTNF